ncbi:MAG: NADH-dependent [FeFe] hydrogenase, group A6 [Defluviitaleaceae bacterium]|nr:NADH-dependent [FeFe] hydrogenase, group A6 [Defluviitaleaceae bacterium]
MANITLNNVKLQVADGITVLEAARANGVNIPTLCHMDMADIKMINKVGTCRVCMVEVVNPNGSSWLAPACATDIWDGMVINTNTPRAIKARRTMVELFISNHPKDCLACERNRNCELQDLAADLNIRDDRYAGKMSKHTKDTSSRSLIRDPEKCVLCRRCETMCNEVQTVGVYSAVNRGLETTIGTAFDFPMLDTACTFCGQCISVCPTGALTQISNIGEVWSEINNPDKVVIVQTAPAVRVALGEEFNMPVGTRVTGKMVAALRRLGFDHVYDTDFAADLTIMEEAHELIDRVKNGGTLPMLTSCCPAWVKFIEHQFPTLLDIPSSCKSPHEMFGAIAKTYLAEKLGVDPGKMVVVSIMPCVAKKYEAAREELANDGNANVDYVLTTREMASMLREAGINFNSLPDEDFDKVMGESSGASVIFGTTGGVIEAAVRTAASWLGGETIKNVDFKELRGMEGIREATVKAGEVELKIGIAHGLGNARTLLENIRDGKCQYHAIEIMACPGGCVGGGGQPFYGNDRTIIAARAKSLYAEDEAKQVRCSHENAEIKALYAEFLEKPGSHKAHELLHTQYVKRDKL